MDKDFIRVRGYAHIIFAARGPSVSEYEAIGSIMRYMHGKYNPNAVRVMLRAIKPIYEEE